MKTRLKTFTESLKIQESNRPSYIDKYRQEYGIIHDRQDYKDVMKKLGITQSKYDEIFDRLEKGISQEKVLRYLIKELGVGKAIAMSVWLGGYEDEDWPSENELKKIAKSLGMDNAMGL